jgi:hypothetical protein
VGEDQSQTSQQRVIVAQAAQILGVTVEAVRGRIKRGTLKHERHNGTVYVLLNADQMPTGHQPGDDQTTDQLRPEAHEELSDELRDRVRFLERMLEEEREARTEERRRHDTLMAQLMQRIPQLEAPPEPPEDTETVEEAPERAEPRPATGGAQEDARRPWWRRVFGR